MRPYWRVLGLVLALAVSLGASLVFRVVWSPDFWNAEIYPDTAEYLNTARGLAAGYGFSMDTTGRRPPGYPLFLAAILKVAGSENLSAVVGVQTALGLLSAGLYAGMTWILFKRRFLTLVSGLVVALDPAIFPYERAILTESFWGFLLSLALLLVVLAAKNPNWYVSLALGVVLGVLAVTHPIVILFLPLVWLALLVAPRVSEAVRFPRRYWILVVLISLLPMLLWTARNRIVLGIGFSSQSGLSAIDLVSGFIDDVSFHSEIEQDLQRTLLEYRAVRVASTGTYMAAIFDALPEMMESTGLSQKDISSILLRMSVKTALQHPAAYYDAVKVGWGQFWTAELVDIPSWMQKASLIKLYVEGFGLYKLIFAVELIAFCALVIYHRSRLSNGEFTMLLMAASIAAITVVAVSVTIGYARYRIPVQPLLSLWILWALVWLYEKLLRPPVSVESMAGV